MIKHNMTQVNMVINTYF